MRHLLLALALIVGSIGFPMCTDGQTPLMESNDAFTCDRGCPVGFNCEFQDADRTMRKAICCPNITALQQLYGDEEHSEPIWDLSEVASLSAGLDSAVETPGETPSLTRQTQKAITTAVPQYQQPRAVSEEFSNAEKDISATIEESTVKPITGSYEEIRNMEEIDQSLTLLESMQEPSTLPAVFIAVEPEGSGEPNEKTVQRKSCAHQRYNTACRNGTIKTQATIRWWKNPETGDCDYYPFGYCPGDRIVESATLRTKAECEMSCHGVRKAVTTGGDKETGIYASVESSTESPLTSNTSESNTTTSGVLTEEKVTTIDLTQAAETDEVDPEKRGENIAIDPIDPTLLLNAVVEPSPPGMSPMDFEATSEMTATSSSETKGLLTGIQPENLEHHLRLNLQSAEQNNTSTKRVHPPLITVHEKIPSGAELPNKDETSNEDVLTGEKLTQRKKENSELLSVGKAHNEGGSLSEESNNLLVVGESTGGIKMRLEPVEKAKVACQATSYRYSCLNGHPSQFVYRWEMVDGVCQSFAYGYCYGEMNHAHPRTQKECLLYCKVQTRRVLSL